MVRLQGSHEDFERPIEIKLPSNRSFGITFTVVFLVIALLPLLGRDNVRTWALIGSAILLAVTLLRPSVLTPFNRLWLRFGLFLHRIVSPLVLLLIYVLAVLPTAVAMRLTGRRPLDLRFDSQANSYWKARQSDAPPRETMRRQF